MAVSDKLGFCMYDVIIIGAGIEGSATAYYLASNSNKKVLLLEQVSYLSLIYFYLYCFSLRYFTLVVVLMVPLG